MSEFEHRELVPFQGRRVEALLATPGDLIPLTDWTDLYLSGDYHFKRRHLQNILERGTSATWAIMVDGVFSGIVILYRGSTLHNMYLAGEVRGIGLGAAIIAHFRPAIIRAKSNMKDGDPTPFYEQNGYHVAGQDALRPHINIMCRDCEAPALSETDAVEERPAAGACFSSTPTASGGAATQEPGPAVALALPSAPSPPPAAVSTARASVDAAATVAAAPPVEKRVRLGKTREQLRDYNTSRSRVRRAKLKALKLEAAAAARAATTGATPATSPTPTAPAAPWTPPTWSFTS